MDEAKEKALLGWLGCLLDTDDGPASLTHLDYSACFINILMYMDSSISLDDYPNTKERVSATKKFLEDFYNTSFVDESLVDFNVLSNATPDAVRKEEIAKVLLLLLCAGIQDKNSDILTAAMKVDASLHWDVRQLIEAVVRPDEPTTSLPADFAKVLLEGSDPGPNDSPGLLHRLVNDNASLSGAISSLSSAKLAILPEMRDSPLRMRIASLNLSSLNDSLQITSPLRAADNDFPITPLEELVNSPQLARKIMQKEKEHRFKMERQLKEKEESLKKCQHDLRTGLHLRDELELDLQESSAQLQRKDSRIRELEEQVQRLRAVQDRLNELGAVWDSNLELERDVESLRSAAQTAETMTKCCQSLKEENSSLYEDLSTLRDKVNALEASQLESSKVQYKSDKLRARVLELEGEVETWRQALEKGQEEKRALEVDMEVLKKVNQQQRQQLLDRSGEFNGCGSGETMGVVADKLIAELQAELDLMRSTWLSPDLHLATKSDLEASQATLTQLKGESDSLQQKVQELSQDLQEAQTQLTDRTDRCQQLQTDLQEAQTQLTDRTDRCQQLQTDLQEAQTQLTDRTDRCQQLQTDLQEAQTQLTDRTDRCQQLQTDLQEAQTQLTDRTDHCQQLKRDVDQAREDHHHLQTTVEELQAQQTACFVQRDDLQTQLDTKQEDCQSLQLDLQTKSQWCLHLETSVHDLQTDCARLTSDLAEKERMLSEVRADLREKSQQYDQLVADLHSKTSQHSLLESEKSQAVAESENDRESLEKVVTLNEELQQQMAERDSQYQTLKEDTERKETERRTLKSDLEDKVRNYTHLEETLERKEQECSELQKDLETKDSAMEKLQKDLGTKDSAMEQLQKDLGTKDSAMEQLQKDLGTKDSAMEKMQKDLGTKDSAMEQLQKDLGTKDSAMEQLQKDLEERQSELKERELAAEVQDAQCLNLQQMLAEKSAEITQLNQRCEGLESELQEQREKRNIMLADLTSTQQQSQQAEVDRVRSSLQSQLEEQVRTVTQDREQQVQALTSQLQEKEADLTQLTSQLQDKEADLTQLTSQLQDKEADLTQLTSQLTSQLQEKEADLTQLTSQLQEKEADLTQLTSQLQDREADLTQLTSQLQEKEADLTQLMSQLQDREADLTQLTSQLQDKEADLTQLTSQLQDKEADLTQLTSQLQDKEADLTQLASQLQGREADLTHLTSDLTSTEEALQNAQELQNQVQQLRSLNQNLEKQVSEKQADVEDLETISSTLKDNLTALSQELNAAKSFGDQVKTDHCRAQAKLTDLEETTTAQLMHAKEEWEREMESLKAAHQDSQAKTTVKIRELEADLQQKEEHVQKLSEELESSRQKLKSVESGHLSAQEELQKEISVKTMELDEEKQKHQLSKQQLEVKLGVMEETLRGTEGSHEDDHKALQDRMADLHNSAAAEQMKLNKVISSQQQQITALEQQVEEQDFIIKQKVKAFLEMEHQHKADVEAFQKTAMSKDKVLQHRISSQTQGHAKLMQKLESYESALNQKEEELQELKQNYAQALQTVQQMGSQREQDLQPSGHLHEEETAEIRQNLQAEDLLLNQTLAARNARQMQRQQERGEEKKEKDSVQENELRTVVKLLVDAIETRSVSQIVPGLTGLGHVPPVSVVQLAKSVEDLLKETEASEHAAQLKEQELLVRLQEAHHSLRLQTTAAAKRSEGSPQLHPHTLTKDTDVIKKIREESEEKIQDLLIRLETQKRQAASDVKETDIYWKQQLSALQDEMEADMKTQQMTFQNELAEQRAEHDTRLTSMLDEQEGTLVGQKALLNDKIQSLQDTLTSARSQFGNTLASKEAEFAQKLEAEAERRVASVHQQLEVRLVEKEAEKEAELQQKLRLQEAEMEQKLENLNHFLQKEMESHRTIRSQMEQDRVKILHLETQLAERCGELEELLQTEHVERGEVVARVVEENQEELLALRQAQEQERQHSLQQIGDLQTETTAIKEQLAVSLQRTEMLQTQLTELESQKNDAAQRLEREVQTQIHTVRHAEEENGRLQAKIAELETVMTRRKSELKTLRSSLEQQKSQRAERESRELQLREQLKSQPIHKDQVRHLSGQLSSLQAEYRTLQAENRAIQEKATQSTKGMAEKLKHYERKCQQSVTQHSLLADRLRAYTEKEAQWKQDSEKMQELSRRLHDLESAHVKSAIPDTLTPSESKSSSTESAPASRYDLRSKAQMDLDGSFTNTLPATPGAAEKQMAALDSVSVASSSSSSRSDRRYSTFSSSSGRCSTYSTGSTKSVVFVPTGAGKLFSCEDEPESPKFEWGRLNELQRRNTLCLPHMKSSYPVETQTVKGQKFDDRAIQQAKAAHNKEQKPGSSPPASSGGSSSSSSSSSSSRKRRPEAMDVDEDPASHAGAPVAQSRKLARHGPLYQRPGPPTPLSERHRKLSDPPRPSSASRKKSSSSSTPGRTPRRSPRHSPRRSPRTRATPRGHRRCYADENVMPDPGRESLAFDVGFSPVKAGSSRILTRQKAFLSKSKLPQIPKPDDYEDDSLSPSGTSPSKSRTASRPTTSQQTPAKGRRKPLSVRNCLHTQL